MKKIFLGLDRDIQKSLMEQLRNLWTHTSTAIEGNTLTLGETAFILSEGLTVSGKSLREHQEITGHANAIELIYTILENDLIGEDDLFRLHRTVQTENTMDIYNPVGAWKRENNGTYHIGDDEKQVFINYVEPKKVPLLMRHWITMLNGYCTEASNEICQDRIIEIYTRLHISFVKIHPFADGNGRMARLLANIPVMKAGLPPILISNKNRYDYIKLLSTYQLESEEPQPDKLVTGNIAAFVGFVNKEYQNSIEIVDNAYKEQKQRDNG